MGMSVAEYEASVGPKNKFFHEAAESVYLSKDGIIPLDPDDEPDPMEDSRSKTKMHSSPSSPSSQF